MARLYFALLLVLSFAIVPAPASAQNTPPTFAPRFDGESPRDEFLPEEPVTVRVILNRANNGDVIQLEDTYFMLDDSSFNAMRNVGDAFGVSDRSDVREGFSVEEVDSEYLDVDGRLVTRTDEDDWAFQLNTARLTTFLTGRYDLPNYRLDVCTPEVKVEDRSSQNASAYVGDNCRQWTIEAGDQPLNISLVLQPEEDDYWDTLAIVAVWVLLATMLLLLPTYFMRKGLKHLGGGAIVTSLCFAVFAGFAFLIALIPFGTIGSPIDDVVMARNLNIGGHVVAVVLPALLCAIPLMAVAIGVVQLPAPPRIAILRDGGAGTAYATGWNGPQSPQPQPQPAGGPPLPSWLDNQSTKPTESQSPVPPQPQPAPPAQTQWMPQQATPSDQQGTSPQSDQPTTRSDKDGWEAPS